MFHSGNIAFAAGALLATLGHADFLREPLKDPGQECSAYDSEGWLTIYDGTAASAEKYWWISNSSHGNGGNWWVAEDPALVAAGKLVAGQKVLWSNQNAGGNGGLLYTMRKYRDAEVVVSFNPGWKNDGGLFMRANGKGQAWQVMFDYRPGGTVGGIWPEGLSAPSQDYYSLATEVKVDKRLATWDMLDWPKIWDAEGFNSIYAKAVGHPSKITAYLTTPGYTVTDYQTTAQSVIAETGYIGLQIHAGEGSWQGGPNKYEFMKVKELDAAGKPVCAPVPANKPYRPRSGSTAIGRTASASAHPSWLLDAKDGLTVSGLIESPYNISVTDVHGRILERITGNGGRVFHEFKGLRKGIYFVNLASAKENRTYKAVRF
jgi:hypothetical protein